MPSKSLKQMMYDAWEAGLSTEYRSDNTFNSWYDAYISQVRYKDRKFTNDAIIAFRKDCRLMHISEACKKHKINYNTGWAIKECRTYKDVE